MSKPRTKLDLLAEALVRYEDELEKVKTQREDMSIAIKAALTDDPDWRRLCVDALARAEGRAG